MVKKLEDYKTLTGRKKKRAASPKLTAKQAELAQVESDLDSLMYQIAKKPADLICFMATMCYNSDDSHMSKEVAEKTKRNIAL